MKNIFCVSLKKLYATISICLFLILPLFFLLSKPAFRKNVFAQDLCDNINYTSCDKTLIKSIFAKINPSSFACKINLYGKSFSADSPYMTDISIFADCEKNILFSPEQNQGYSPDIAAFDFLSKGYEQIFYAASTGGSGGYGYFYVFDLSCGCAKVLFDFSKFKNIYRAEYGDNYTAYIYKDDLPCWCIDLSKRKDLHYMWNEDGKFISDQSPMVSDLNFAEPSYIYSLSRYRLNLWQKITLSCQADVAGYIITTLDLADNTTMTNIMSI